MASVEEIKSAIDELRNRIFEKGKELFTVRRNLIEEQLKILKEKAEKIVVPTQHQIATTEIPERGIPLLPTEKAVAPTPIRTTDFTNLPSNTRVSLFDGKKGTILQTDTKAGVRGYILREDNTHNQFFIAVSDISEVITTSEGQIPTIPLTTPTPTPLPISPLPAQDKFRGLAKGTRVKLVNGDVGTIISVDSIDNTKYGFENETRNMSQVISAGDISEILPAITNFKITLSNKRQSGNEILVDVNVANIEDNDFPLEWTFEDKNREQKQIGFGTENKATFTATGITSVSTTFRRNRITIRNRDSTKSTFEEIDTEF